MHPFILPLHSINLHDNNNKNKIIYIERENMLSFPVTLQMYFISKILIDSKIENLYNTLKYTMQKMMDLRQKHSSDSEKEHFKNETVHTLCHHLIPVILHITHRLQKGHHSYIQFLSHAQ